MNDGQVVKCCNDGDFHKYKHIEIIFCNFVLIRI